MPYKNLEWKKRQKDIEILWRKSKLSEVSKLHTGEWNNASTEMDEWNAAGTISQWNPVRNVT